METHAEQVAHGERLKAARLALRELLSPHSRLNPVKLPELVGALATRGIVLHERDVREAVKQLETQGVLDVVSGVKGYWIARDTTDAEAVLKAEKTLREHADAELRRADRLHRIASKLTRTPRKTERAKENNTIGLFE